MKKMNLKDKKIWVSGHNGMVGSAICRLLVERGITPVVVGRKDLDLTEQATVRSWMHDVKPDVVFLAAAKVGGIHANDTYPADFLFDNLMIETNIIRTAHEIGVEKLIFLGSSCIYPRDADQPISERALLTGPLEPTNEWYAVAKIAGIKLCQAFRAQHDDDFIAVMPTNLYGPGDNFHPENSHVPAALLDRFHKAKLSDSEIVTVWGTGTPRREFLYVDDLAEACIYLAEKYSGSDLINIGTGADVTIREFAEAISSVVGYKGRIEYDSSRPDGMPRKVLDVSALASLGWTYTTDLETGLGKYYQWYLDNIDQLRHADKGDAH
ncbi:GDP-L-fucose synthase family protein [Aestuariispira insulae]|uniref:GDP-L-fucose synthase n=1 Tax=Aestuariispira insulae TaxID=1461337 RepID=A0A3D9H4A0_9PROT|nr:GDP-L-fucose synthase [Aestuariispira insulae]RED44312.1 GDP-L-fucose synthase [Aestuariispira insulae]